MNGPKNSFGFSTTAVSSELVLDQAAKKERSRDSLFKLKIHRFSRVIPNFSDSELSMINR